MENRIKKVIGSVFGIDPATITENDSPDSIPNWDSLRHMNLIVALEEEFEIEFTEDEIMDMLNYKILYTIIKEKTGL
ncbi:MAG: acyl carrier protein [Chitinophagaceae bacterium]|nr:acyl carrier protein [Chitinophagaceae bacterium]